MFKLLKIRVYEISRWPTEATLRLPFQNKVKRNEIQAHGCTSFLLSALALRVATEKEDLSHSPPYSEEIPFWRRDTLEGTPNSGTSSSTVDFWLMRLLRTPVYDPFLTKHLSKGG